MNILRQNKSRAKAAISLIWVVLALEIISLVSGYFQYNLLLTIEDGIYVSAAKIAANDIREQSIGILLLLASVISAITFIQWFRRAYFNLHSISSNVLYSEGWAAGSWFVPIICLYRPFQIMKELYEEINLYLSSKGAVLRLELTTSKLGLWWTLWILNNIMGQIVFRMADAADTFGELKAITLLSIGGNIIGVILALVTIKVIRDYSEAELVLFNLKDENVIVEDKKAEVNY